MKAVLISIQPKWCELIASGKKLIEVRKTRPKLETPFKCFIYCTKDRHYQITEEKTNILDFNKFNIFISRGKVIGEFVCDWIKEIEPHCDIVGQVNQYIHHYPAILGSDCLSFQEMKSYLGCKKGFDWHISDLKIYDKPKELREFTYPCKKGKKCFNTDTNCKGCKYAFKGVTKGKIYCDRCVITAPQSWCYVEK